MPWPIFRRSSRQIVLTIFLPFTAAYLISELYRNVNGVIAPELRQTFDIGPVGLGFLSSVFLIAIAAAQIPVGVLLDRYGSRRVVAPMLLLAAAGAVLFTMPSYPAAVGGRLLLGLGLGACWAGAYRANVLSWPRERLPLVNGALLGLSGLGALAATRPVEAVLSLISWQSFFLGLAAITTLLAILIFAVVPSESEDIDASGSETLAEVLHGFRKVVGHPLFRRVWPLTFMCEGTWLAYQGLWGGVWLRQVSDLDSTAAANVLFAFALAIVVGQIVLSGLTGWLVKRGARLEWMMAGITGGFIATQCFIAFFPRAMPTASWTSLGLLTAGPILAYAWLTTELPHAWAGRVVSLINLCATLAGFLLQYAVGGLIDLFSIVSGSEPNAQRWAFGLLIGGEATALLWFLASNWLPRRMWATQVREVAGQIDR
ncbi:MFS transporter [Salinisphaera sp. Q1T1-3]|uniref:MFS transporter n=1 Tax=Salinisphaera sp. Q1T1-3 TaxID=2321229 RepID=UPI000E75765D|nr:MFS transporter [Salinisphaera sp. Q1T1-3]RJS94625.1 MFS transporter [Salinisphaera sp. Q1T1-3]